MFSSYTLFKVRGVPVKIHLSTIIFLLLLIRPRFDLAFSLLLMLISLASILLHEIGHMLVAQRYGITVEHLALTPIGGMAKLQQLPDNPHLDIRISLAGPMLNLFLAALIYPWLLIDSTEPIHYLLASALLMNLSFGLINLIPSLPMDGGRILRSWLLQRKGKLEATRIASTYGKYVGVIMIFLSFVLNMPFLVIIGLFILFYSGAEYRIVKVVQSQTQSASRPIERSDHEFNVGPAPYEKAKTTSTLKGSLLQDVWITATDLWKALLQK